MAETPIVDHDFRNLAEESTFTAAEKDAMRSSLEMDNSEYMRLHQEMLVEKWGGKTSKGYDSRRDWLGQGSVDKGFQKLADNQKAKMAVLLENQARFQRSKEARVVNGRVLMQDTTTSDEALPTKFALPIVRRTYAMMTQADWSVTQPLPGPTGYVFWMDFLREADATNILSVEYNAFVNLELSVPAKAKLQMNRAQITVVKQILGMTWSLEALEDGRAQIGIDVEQELLGAFSTELVRNLFGRHLLEINNKAVNGTATGAALTAPWAGANTQHQIAARGGTAINDYKSIVYNALIDADTDFQRANRRPSTGILCGYGLAGFLRKLLTATSASEPDDSNMASVGLTNYGNYASRWQIWGTDFLPDDAGFMYVRNPNQLEAAHVYCPYIPIQVMPAVYGDYDSSTGNYQNKDAFTRNIRERSAQIVTKPYGFQPIKGPAGLSF
jgi:hypothetical protein